MLRELKRRTVPSIIVFGLILIASRDERIISPEQNNIPLRAVLQGNIYTISSMYLIRQRIKNKIK
jgi:hypothetical protein